MNVAIIGHGNMGSALAGALVSAGHQVWLAGRDQDKVAAVAATTGATASSLVDAVQQAEVVFLALPFAAMAEALAAAGDLAGKVVVDICNPISADFKQLVIGHTTSAGEQVQRWAPAARVVKAFNTLFAPLLAPAARGDKTLQVFMASDDSAAKAVLASLVQSIGFEAVDAGGLENCRLLEPVGLMNIQFGYFLGQGPAVAPGWVKV
jgi:hypothetical protein